MPTVGTPAVSLDWEPWFPCETESPGIQILQALQDDPATPMLSNLASQGSMCGVIDTSPQAHPVQADQLKFLQYPEWDQEKDYREDPPTCIRYTIEWKITLNNRTIVKNTERDVVLQPAAFFDVVLLPKVEATVAKKISPDKNVQLEDIRILVSVNDRTQRDLNTTLDSMDIDWTEVEEQLVEWGELCRAGKKLRMNVSFNHKEVIPNEVSTSASRGARGRWSATRAMLADRASQVDAEEALTGQASVWASMYRLMRCPGPPCDLGPHCLIEAETKKHRRLKAHHMRQIVDYVQQGGHITTHNDVPQAIRDQLKAEETERGQRHFKTNASQFPPINITNVLPPLTSQSVPPLAANGISGTEGSIRPSQPCRLKISGPRDAALKDFCEWQAMQVDDPVLKKDFQKAHEVALAHALDLEILYEDNDSEFLVKNGLKRGTARHMVGGIPEWVKKFKRGHFEE